MSTAVPATVSTPCSMYLQPCRKYDDCWRAAVSLNNTGTYLLERGLYSEAHEIMRDSVTVLVQCVLFRQTYNPPQVHVPTVLQHAKQHLINATSTAPSPTRLSSGVPVVSLSITDLAASLKVVDQFMSKGNDNCNSDNQKIEDGKLVTLRESSIQDIDEGFYDNSDMLLMHENDEDDQIWMYDEDDYEQPLHVQRQFIPLLFRIDTTELFCLNLYACTIIYNFATCTHCLAMHTTNYVINGTSRDASHGTCEQLKESMERLHSLLDLAHRAAFRLFEGTPPTIQNHDSDNRIHLTLVLAFVMHNMGHVMHCLGSESTKVLRYERHSCSLRDVLIQMGSTNMIAPSIGAEAA